MKVKVGLVQMSVSNSKTENLHKAKKMIEKAARQGAKLVVLPEMFNCPYQTQNFPLYAESEKGETWQHLSDLAKENKIYLIGGSIPELDKNKVFNTSFIFDDQGKQIGKHRKVHLFDINIQGGQYFKESDTLSAGNSVTVVDSPFGKIAIMICYDIRFPELARLSIQQGAEIIVIPGAFNMTTGPAHWELLFRARALDNQVYVMGCAPARNIEIGYVSYANSIITDPWGKVVNSLSYNENILLEELDLELIKKIRQELPILNHLRQDLYRITKY